jgi:hypothetical protein
VLVEAVVVVVVVLEGRSTQHNKLTARNTTPHNATQRLKPAITFGSQRFFLAIPFHTSHAAQQ